MVRMAPISAPIRGSPGEFRVTWLAHTRRRDEDDGSGGCCGAHVTVSDPVAAAVAPLVLAVSLNRLLWSAARSMPVAWLVATAVGVAVWSTPLE